MRILLISEMFPPDFDGGQEVNAEKIAVGLIERGHTVTVLTAAFRPSYQGAQDTRMWVRRVLKHGPHKMLDTNLWERFAAIRWYIAELIIHKKNLQAARKLLKEEPHDLAYIFGLSRTGWSLALAPTEAGIPILWHQGGNNLEGRLLEMPKLGRIARFFRKLQDAELKMDVSNIAYVSQFLIDDSRQRGFVGQNGRGTNRTVIIPRGIEFPVQRDIDRPRDEPPVFLMAGRIAFFKGFHVAIESARLLRDRRPDLPWVLHIVGDPDDNDFHGGEPGSVYLARLKTKVAECGLESRVAFLGKRNRAELQELLRRATAFISASNCGEAFANTIIECLANGTPILVSRDGSALEVVTDQESGLAFDPEDASELAALMERILTEPGLARRLAVQGARVIQERYTLDRVLALTEQVMEDLIDQRRSVTSRA